MWTVFFIIFVVLCLLCCGGKIGVEGKIIGNDQSSINARRCEMVWRVRKGRKNENAGRLEQSGHGLNITRIVWRD